MKRTARVTRIFFYLCPAFTFLFIYNVSSIELNYELFFFFTFSAAFPTAFIRGKPSRKQGFLIGIRVRNPIFSTVFPTLFDLAIFSLSLNVHYFLEVRHQIVCS